MRHECIGKIAHTFDHQIRACRTKYRRVELIDDSEYRTPVLLLTMTLLKSHFEMIDVHKIRFAGTRQKSYQQR